MGLITSPGAGSGLDVNSIIAALTNAERSPVELRLNRQEAKTQATISGLGGLSSSLSSLKTAIEKLDAVTDFNQRSITYTDSQYFSASSSATAGLGTYSIEVVNLAKGSQRQSGLIAGGTSTTYVDGNLTFTVGASTFNVAIASTDNLVDIQNKINSASDNFGVSAAVITTDSGTKIVYSSSKTGVGNDLSVTNDNAGLNEISTSTTLTTASDDARIKISGDLVSSATNTFTDSIQGITLTAKKANTTGVTSDFTVATDTASVKTAVEGFVKAINQSIKDLTKLTLSNTQESGPLANDAATRSVLSKLKSFISETISSVSSDYNSLTSLGVTTTRTGDVELKSATLTKALENNYSDVISLFTNSDGVAAKLKTFVDGQINSGGVITSRQSSLQTELTRIFKQREALDLRINTYESTLRRQYAALDSIVAQFQGTSSFIAQNLTRLPNYGNNKS